MFSDVTSKFNLVAKNEGLALMARVIFERDLIKITNSQFNFVKAFDFGRDFRES